MNIYSPIRNVVQDEGRPPNCKFSLIFKKKINDIKVHPIRRGECTVTLILIAPLTRQILESYRGRNVTPKTFNNLLEVKSSRTAILIPKFLFAFLI